MKERNSLYIIYFASLLSLSVGGGIIQFIIMKLMDPLSGFFAAIIWLIFWLTKALQCARELKEEKDETE